MPPHRTPRPPIKASAIPTIATITTTSAKASTSPYARSSTKPAAASSIIKANKPTDDKVTPYQSRVYELLTQIPRGKLTTYANLARALGSSPRAVGNACRRNPFAPEVPCHRVISSTGYVAGYKGEWEDAPSGVNQSMKLELLREEGLEFDEGGMLITGLKGKGISTSGIMFDGPWKVPP